MNDRRPKIQLHMAVPEEEQSETPRASGQGTEPFAATRNSEHRALAAVVAFRVLVASLVVRKDSCEDCAIAGVVRSCAACMVAARQRLA